MVETLGDVVAAGAYDLVLAHGLLEDVDDPASVMRGLAQAVRPGGQVSVAVANPVSAVLSRVLAGDLVAAQSALAAQSVTPLSAQSVTPQSAQAGQSAGRVDLESLCVEAGLVVEQVNGLGVFTEFAGREDSDGALAELEVLASAQAPYRDIAARRHVLARRPSAS